MVPSSRPGLVQLATGSVAQWPTLPSTHASNQWSSTGLPTGLSTGPVDSGIEQRLAQWETTGLATVIFDQYRP
ncbi:hypothetical protein B0T21DRAFT_184917 [Apiosordaria backusii]|uniref:Uncharacterized protein n=1 Tax=Apiosordaria backusii TaxID=314023 RepID=A0AA40EF87_9PEZI|nr:hypothetical protein B0T21DRAFT_184917 [Apiosordaria backusii]